MTASIKILDFSVSGIVGASLPGQDAPNLPPLDQLRRLPIGELRRLWTERFGQRPELEPPRVKALIARDLVWQGQQGSHGGFDAQTLSLLSAAVRPYLADPDRQRGDAVGTPKNGRRRAGSAKVKLPAGTQLVRSWRGVEHTVTVLEDGKSYRYRDQAYRSLTVIAEQITGAHWSGPRFFGLNRIRSIR